MAKKIVILNGSPRKKGNTSALIKAFTEGAESAGNAVAEFFLDSMNIHGCKGCFCGGVMGIGDIEGNAKLEEARRLGASIN